MARIEELFVTRIYRTALAPRRPRFNADIKEACLAIAAEDRAGQAWCRANTYRGYTSYASLNDLPWRSPAFGDLVQEIDSHVAEFARALAFDLGGRILTCDSIWINILDPGGFHTAHIHPHSVVSGTYYVDVPDGASAIRFEDPRLALMMSAPPRKANARRPLRTFVTEEPKAGTLLLWESWLRHEVPVNEARHPRISVSFNYRWG
jgi:uncharacterized protein (TIGR02466 family)